MKREFIVEMERGMNVSPLTEPEMKGSAGQFD